MNPVETHSVQSAATAVTTSNGPPTSVPEKRRRSAFGKTVLILLIGGAAGGALYAYAAGMERVHRNIDRTINSVPKYLGGTTAEAKPKEIKPHSPWNGLVRIPADEAKNIGLLVVTVQPQVEPIKLELPGRTAYDPNSMTKIRPRFDTLVEKVYVELGETVKKGQPLLELFSTDLAAAKNEFQTAYVQWQHDLTLRTHREALIKGDAISGQALIDSRNDENKSRLAVTTARQKLIVFKVPEEQIDPLIKNLNPNDLPDKDAILQLRGQGEDDDSLSGRRQGRSA